MVVLSRRSSIEVWPNWRLQIPSVVGTDFAKVEGRRAILIPPPSEMERKEEPKNELIKMIIAEEHMA